MALISVQCIFMIYRTAKKIGCVLVLEIGIRLNQGTEIVNSGEHYPTKLKTSERAWSVVIV